MGPVRGGCVRIYGDAEQFAARRRLFVVGPMVLAGVIALGLTFSFTLVAVAGGLWNMEHTLMQRYGFVRIYGRRTGEDDGRLVRAGTANRTKQLYVVSTAVMFAFAVLVDPVAGLAGYAGAHAVEYFFIVDQLATSRPTVSRRRFFFGYLAVFGILYLLVRQTDQIYLLVVLFFGGLHFLFPQPMTANVSA